MPEQVLIAGIYQAAPAAVADGQCPVLAMDQYGRAYTVPPSYEDTNASVAAVAAKPLASGTYSWNRKLLDATSGAVQSGNSQFCGLVAFNSSAAALYIQLFNAAAVPAPGSAPDLVFGLAASASIALGPGQIGLNGFNLSNGLSYAISTTAYTLTEAGSPDVVGQVFYK